MNETVKVTPGVDLDRNVTSKLYSILLNRLVMGVIYAFYSRECVKPTSNTCHV
jgi:hypothetical protein